MASAIISAIISVAKISTITAGFLDGLLAAWSLVLRQRNQHDETSKNQRDTDLIDGAGQRLLVCDACPFAGHGGGQHGASVAAPAVPLGGSGRT